MIIGSGHYQTEIKRKKEIEKNAPEEPETFSKLSTVARTLSEE